MPRINVTLDSNSGVSTNNGFLNPLPPRCCMFPEIPNPPTHLIPDGTTTPSGWRVISYTSLISLGPLAPGAVVKGGEDAMKPHEISVQSQTY